MALYSQLHAHHQVFRLTRGEDFGKNKQSEGEKTKIKMCMKVVFLPAELDSNGTQSHLNNLNTKIPASWIKINLHLQKSS